MLPLICIDVDGTLIGSSGAPTPGVWAAVDAALERGQHLALTTARGAFGPTRDYARRLDPAGWHIFHAGAALLHTGTGETVAEPLPTPTIGAVVDVGRDGGWVTEFYSANDYTVDSDDPLAVRHAALQGVPHRRRPPSALADPVVRMQLVVPDTDVDEIVRLLGSTGAVSVAASPVMTGIAFVSITRPHISKATAIATIADRLGVTLADVMMVGDGHNDLDAIEAVGHGVAMGNAVGALKAAARHHVDDVDRDGLAEALMLSATLEPGWDANDPRNRAARQRGSI